MRLGDCAWPEIETRLAAGALAVLPVGAASKEHGRHLPLASDYLQAEWLADRVAEHRNVVVWPTLAYGYYPVFIDYPGSNSLSRATFVAVVQELLAGVAQAGAGRAALLNTGISTIEPLEAALAAGDSGMPVTLVNVYAGPRLAAARRVLEEQAWGGHADEIETSIMLAIAPHRVDMARAEPAPTPILRGMFNRHDPQAPNYSPAGVNGDPTRASLVKGRQLLDALLQDVLAVLPQG